MGFISAHGFLSLPLEEDEMRIKVKWESYEDMLKCVCRRERMMWWPLHLSQHAT